MADTFAKVTSNDPAIVSAAVYAVLDSVGSATASYTMTDGVISVEIGKAEPVKVVNTIIVGSGGGAGSGAVSVGSGGGSTLVPVSEPQPTVEADPAPPAEAQA